MPMEALENPLTGVGPPPEIILHTHTLIPYHITADSGAGSALLLSQSLTSYAFFTFQLSLHLQPCLTVG